MMKIYMIYMYHDNCGGWGCCDVSYYRLVLANNKEEAKQVLIDFEKPMCDEQSIETELVKIEELDIKSIFRKRKPRLIF